MLNKLEQLEQLAKTQLEKAKSLEDISGLRVKLLGRKGEVTQLLRGLKDLPDASKVEMGKTANRIKNDIEFKLNQKEDEIKNMLLNQRLNQEKIDVTLPGKIIPFGKLHPLTQVTQEISEIFIGMGFSVAEGPEIETDYYNFEALNLAKDHPARDMQDTFYITEDIVLRTHTSPVQVRTMEKMAPQVPVKIIVPGKVYRKDDDATHSPMFHQIEGLVIDNNINFAHLKGTLMLFARKVFGSQVNVRYRPSFFPFTEPSAEMDISCVECGGQGCRMCSFTGWLEILGSGMVHPNVLRYGGYDPEKVTGFAFGLGIERIAMLKYGVNDMRLFYDNDIRFLQQF